jgi:hypothetical protein
VAGDLIEHVLEEWQARVEIGASPLPSRLTETLICVSSVSRLTVALRSVMVSSTRQRALHYR